MDVTATTQPPGASGADTVVVGVLDGEPASADAPAQVAALLSSGEARSSFKSLALTHVDQQRWLLVGLGPRGDLTAERARAVAAVARDRARELSTTKLCWQLPSDAGADVAAALVEGTVLADYRFERHKSKSPDGVDAPPRELEALIIAAAVELGETVSAAALVADAVNAARDLQNRPGNDLTPTALAAHSEALAREIDGLSVEVEGRDGIVARGMGAFAAVAQGSYQEPALITMRYDPPGATGPLLGFVGKAVTFDSGGISLKPGAKMSEMKFDMSGGAAVIEALAAIARLQMPVRIVAVVGATENLPSGRSVKPGDIVRAAN
ncbi:MAG TPA: M17 family peptidase N-terminal domain-containing protein, partial [Solirubrobacteraceae bacterium]